MHVGVGHIDHMASTYPQESYLILKDGGRAAESSRIPPTIAPAKIVIPLNQ